MNRNLNGDTIWESARRTLAGKAQTVIGAIGAEHLGVTLPHEHLLIDMSHLMQEPKEASARARFHAPLTMGLLGAIAYGGQTNLDNNRLLDVRTAIEEATLYKDAGGRTIVDVTSVGLRADPNGMVEIARATGLNIVMGCSYFVDASHPPDFEEKNEDDIMQEIARAVFEGVDGTEVRAGIIGEVGCSWPLTASERKVLRASGRAQQLTGACLTIHPGEHEEAPLEIIEVLRDVGTDISRTIVCHVDLTVFQKTTLRKLADTGCILEYDLFGHENSYYRVAPHLDLPNDGQRLRWLDWLIGEGLRDQIMISHDTGTKRDLVRYGGPGYAHILKNILPRMRRRGFGEQDVRAILIETPKRLLVFP